jgi:hypothetical protein
VGLETFFGKQNSPLDPPPSTAAATAATTPVGSPQVEERATNSSHTTPSTSSRDLKNAAKVKQFNLNGTVPSYSEVFFISFSALCADLKDPDPAPHQNDANLRLLVCKPPMAPF